MGLEVAGSSAICNTEFPGSFFRDQKASIQSTGSLVELRPCFFKKSGFTHPFFTSISSNSVGLPLSSYQSSLFFILLGVDTLLRKVLRLKISENLCLIRTDPVSFFGTVGAQADWNAKLIGSTTMPAGFSFLQYADTGNPDSWIDFFLPALTPSTGKCNYLPSIVDSLAFDFAFSKMNP